jgi:large subunit ribosomal protein L3
MPKRKRPVRGSHGYWPRKRAKRIYPRIERWPRAVEARPLGFAGYKAGMSHAILIDTNPNSRTSGQPVARAVTILECPPLAIFGMRAYIRDDARLLSAVDVLAEKLSKDLARRFKLPKRPKTQVQMAKLKKIRPVSVHLLCHAQPTFKKSPEIFELAIGGPVDKQLELAIKLLGKSIKVSEIFKPGDYVDAVAITRGKGSSGPVKRFGIKILGRKYQAMERHIGVHGPRVPGKRRSTIPQMGQLGFQSRTDLNKRIIKIGTGTDINPAGDFLRYGKVRSDYLVLEGSVPGPVKRLIRLRAALRPPRVRYPVELREISTSSKQGV